MASDPKRKNWFKRVWCAIRDHGGIAGSGRYCRCKHCGATVDIWPRAWRKAAAPLEGERNG